MTLLNETYTYLCDESETKFLFIFIILKLILNIFVSYIMVLISNGQFNLIIYYIGLLYIQKIFDPLIIDPIITRLTNNIQKKFYKNYTLQYDKLTYECKNSKIHSQFIENINLANHSITNIIEWGLHQIISLTSAIISVYITFYKKKLIKHLLAFIMIYGVFYHFIFKKKQEQYSKLQKKNQKKRSQNNTKEYLYSVPFQYNEISPEFMINIKKNSLDCQLENNNAWNKLILLNDSMIEFISSILIYLSSSDIVTFMLIIISMNKLSGAINGLSNFMTMYQRINSDFNNFTEFWLNDLEFKKDFVKLSIHDHPIEINKIDIQRGKYHIMNDTSLEKINFYPGIKVLIQGPSGHGKSTFLKGVFGLIKTSINFSYGSGIQYYYSVSDYFQEIKERMPSSKVSLRDYFKGETNNQIIKDYLLRAWGEEEYERIIDSIKNHRKEIESNETDLLITIDPIHEYDLLINEKLSGGQKSRLILWTRGYNIDQSHKEIIILDEPCPDVDFDGYIDNLKRFYQKYQHCSIFLIGHLCECKRKSLNIKFDMELWIENGLIKKL